MVWRFEVEGKKFYHEHVTTRGKAETLRTQLKKQGWEEVKTKVVPKGIQVLWRGAPKKGKK